MLKIPLPSSFETVKIIFIILITNIIRFKWQLYNKQYYMYINYIINYIINAISKSISLRKSGQPCICVYTHIMQFN